MDIAPVFIVLAVFKKGVINGGVALCNLSVMFAISTVAANVDIHPVGQCYHKRRPKGVPSLEKPS